MPDLRLTTKPFASEAQQRYAFGTDQPWAKRWADETDFSKLPKRVRRIRSKRVKGCTCKALGEGATGGRAVTPGAAPAKPASAPKGESLGPGITRIRGNLCNVHGRYGPCDAALSKKPKGGKGRAAKPKQTPEQKRAARQHARAERQQERTAEQGAQRAAVFQQLDVPAKAAESLAALARGEQVDDEGLVKMGLAERDTNGELRMTATGRQLMNAAERGDAGAARDAISQAGDNVAHAGERAAAAETRRQERTAAQAERERARQERQAKLEARRAKRSGSGGGSGAATPERPGLKPIARAHSRGSGGGALSTGGSSGSAAPEKPKPAPKPEQPKEPKPEKPNIAPELRAAVQKLSAGEQMTDDEVQALVRDGLARLDKDGNPILTAAGLNATKKARRERFKATRHKALTPDRVLDAGHSGVAVLLRPDPAAAQAIAGQPGVTESVEQLHLTLCFLGDSSETPLATNKARLLNDVALWAMTHGKPLHGTVNGAGRFFHSESDNTNAVYVAPDVPGLSELRQTLVQWIESSGFDYSSDHGFTPHITVAYVPVDAPTPPIRVETPIVFDRVTLAWGDAQYDFPLGMPPPVTKDVTFSVFKDASGVDRWLTASSTAYRDRDREIVSTKALARAVALADASGYRGPLRFWHVPGVELGDCDYQATAQDGRFLIESGTFRGPALAAAVKAHAGDYRVSIGFTHPADEPDAQGVFHHIAIFERSLVPAGRASNPFTHVTVKEQRMLTTEKQAALRELLGGDDSLLQGLLGQVAQTDKAAQDGGIAYKEAPDVRAMIREELAALLAAQKDAAPAETTEKAAPSVDAAVEAKADVPAELAEALDETAVEEVGDENMLTEAEVQAIAAAVVSAITPLLDIETKMAGYLNEMKGLMGGIASQKDTAIAELKGDLETVKAQVADLSGSQPRILAGGYRASQAQATVTTDDTKLKAAQPAADPVAQSFGAFMSDLGLGGPIAGA